MVRSGRHHHTVLSMWLHDPLLRVMLIGANHLLSDHLTRMLVQDQISRRFGRLLQQCALAKVMLLVVGQVPSLNRVGHLPMAHRRFFQNPMLEKLPMV